MKALPLVLASILASGVACQGMRQIPPAHGQPVDLEGLVGTAWKAEEIAGEPVRDPHPPMLYFESADAVSGYAGCNQFGGPLSGGSSDLGFGPLAVTRRACEEARMQLEVRFLQALSREPLRLQGSGPLLYLVDADGRVAIRFLQHVLPGEGAGGEGP